VRRFHSTCGFTDGRIAFDFSDFFNSGPDHLAEPVAFFSWGMLSRSQRCRQACLGGGDGCRDVRAIVDAQSPMGLQGREKDRHRDWRLGIAVAGRILGMSFQDEVLGAGQAMGVGRIGWIIDPAIQLDGGFGLIRGGCPFYSVRPI